MAQLEPPAVEAILSACRPLQLKPGTLIHARGDACNGMYGLESGQIQVGAVAGNGDEFVMTRLQDGEWFGEIAVLDGGPRTHDTLAITHCELAWLSMNTIQRLRAEHTEIDRWMGLLLCHHVRSSFEAIDQFLILSPRQRLAQRLLQISQNQNDTRVTVNQAEMGSLIGLSRQSVNKLLKQWQDNGWLEIGYGYVEIKRQDGLYTLLR